MTKYDVYYSATATVRVEVHADTREKAEELADREVFVNLCHQCAHEVDIDDAFELLETVEAEA